MWNTFDSRDYSYFYLSGSVLSDYTIRWKTTQTAVRTWSKVKITVRNWKKLGDFSNRPLNAG